MSDDGWRPAVVVSESSRNRLPLLGPRRTTSSAEPGGSASTAAWSAVDSASDRSLSPSPGSKPALIVMVDVSPGDGAGAVGLSAAPQLLQKRASSVLLCPHWVQNGIEAASLATRAGGGLVDGCCGPGYDLRSGRTGRTVDLHPRSREWWCRNLCPDPTRVNRGPARRLRRAGSGVE